MQADHVQQLQWPTLLTIQPACVLLRVLQATSKTQQQADAWSTAHPDHLPMKEQDNVLQHVLLAISDLVWQELVFEPAPLATTQIQQHKIVQLTVVLDHMEIQIQIHVFRNALILSLLTHQTTFASVSVLLVFTETTWQWNVLLPPIVIQTRLVILRQENV